MCFSWKVAHHGSKLLCPERRIQQIVPECSDISMVYSHCWCWLKMTSSSTTDFLPQRICWTKTSEASCVAVYRVPSPSAGTILLNHFHQPGTISHAVLGGHGSDNTWRLGLNSRNDFFWGSGFLECRKPKGRGMFFIFQGFTMVVPD